MKFHNRHHTNVYDNNFYLPKFWEDGISPNSEVGSAARANRCFCAANSESDILCGEEILG